MPTYSNKELRALLAQAGYRPGKEDPVLVLAQAGHTGAAQQYLARRVRQGRTWVLPNN